ncbi:hypothetical protein IMZ48_36040 [Candidatus Bathyarchaeota archaeon]|nr:hypothetical protein [Candidatus Bathyarchaeota archaeon]
MLPYALLAFLLAEAAAQGFYENCSRWTLGWDDSTVYKWIMVAGCTDDRGEPHTSFIPLSDCYANREGEIVPERR